MIKFYKNLSYRRDSERPQSLRRSRLFKVINYFDTNRKPACDFILVNNTSYITVLHARRRLSYGKACLSKHKY